MLRQLQRSLRSKSRPPHGPDRQPRRILRALSRDLYRDPAGRRHPAILASTSRRPSQRRHRLRRHSPRHQSAPNYRLRAIPRTVNPGQSRARSTNNGLPGTLMRGSRNRRLRRIHRPASPRLRDATFRGQVHRRLRLSRASLRIPRGPLSERSKIRERQPTRRIHATWYLQQLVRVRRRE